MMLRIVLLALLVAADAFFHPVIPHRETFELMAGFGAALEKKKSRSKAKKTTPSFDVSASVLRLGKLYDKLMLQHAKSLSSDEEDEIFATEYVVAIKARHYDWVPVAQICLVRPHLTSDTELTAVVSKYCRELSFVASLGSNMFQSIPRDQFQYAVESSDSFHKYVYEPLERHSDDLPMSKQQAREILNIHNGEDIKRQYRLLLKEYHPDRFVNSDRTEQQVLDAANMYEKVQSAYAILQNGVGQSWYESLGGRTRTDFCKLNLMSIGDATKHLEKSQIQAAVVALDPDLVQSFLARSRQ